MPHQAHDKAYLHSLLARRSQTGEILLTSAAVAALPPERHLLREITPEIGGAEQTAFSLQACMVERPLGPAA